MRITRETRPRIWEFRPDGHQGASGTRVMGQASDPALDGGARLGLVRAIAVLPLMTTRKMRCFGQAKDVGAWAEICGP